MLCNLTVGHSLCHQLQDAQHLMLSRYTIESHVKNIYQKMSVTSRTRAIHVARQHGLIKD